MKRALSLFPHIPCPPPVSLRVFCNLPCPCLDPFTTSCLSFSSLQRCRCHRCFASPQSESYRFRSGTSTPRVSSWSLSTRLSIPVALVMHTFSASCTGLCWSERHPGMQTEQTLVFSIITSFIELNGKSPTLPKETMQLLLVLMIPLFSIRYFPT